MAGHSESNKKMRPCHFLSFFEMKGDHHPSATEDRTRLLGMTSLQKEHTHPARYGRFMKTIILYRHRNLKYTLPYLIDDHVSEEDS